jgi:hypothetical protein
MNNSLASCDYRGKNLALDRLDLVKIKLNEIDSCFDAIVDIPSNQIQPDVLKLGVLLAELGEIVK